MVFSTQILCTLNNHIIWMEMTIRKQKLLFSSSSCLVGFDPNCVFLNYKEARSRMLGAISQLAGI
jgi:hypothetical protein